MQQQPTELTEKYESDAPNKKRRRGRRRRRRREEAEEAEEEEEEGKGEEGGGERMRFNNHATSNARDNNPRRTERQESGAEDKATEPDPRVHVRDACYAHTILTRQNAQWRKTASGNTHSVVSRAIVKRGKE